MTQMRRFNAMRQVAPKFSSMVVDPLLFTSREHRYLFGEKFITALDQDHKWIPRWLKLNAMAVILLAVREIIHIAKAINEVTVPAQPTIPATTTRAAPLGIGESSSSRKEDNKALAILSSMWNFIHPFLVFLLSADINYFQTLGVQSQMTNRFWILLNQVTVSNFPTLLFKTNGPLKL